MERKLDFIPSWTQPKSHGVQVGLPLLWNALENSLPLKNARAILKVEPRRLLFQLLPRILPHCLSTESIIKNTKPNLMLFQMHHAPLTVWLPWRRSSMTTSPSLKVKICLFRTHDYRPCCYCFPSRR